MSFKKNQKTYNKEVMATGREANRYLSKALGLINQYTTNYADRTDFWTNKLNNRQLDLLSDKYLKQNANMLRGQAQFGSNSALNQQMNENAYSQQNYLANVANENIKTANQLQNNELTSLMNASKTYETPIANGQTAAQNVDAANNAWMKPASGVLKGAGAVASMFPGIGTAVGAGLNMAGSALGSMAGESQTYQTKDGQQVNNFELAGTRLGEGIRKQLSTRGGNSGTTLSGDGSLYDKVMRNIQSGKYA